ncbi:MAG: 50S ribosomal protein L28 [Bacteroidota bacterium]
MAKICQITGKKAIVGNSVSHSMTHTKRVFNVNLSKRKFYLEEEKRWIDLMVSNKGVRVINKVGLYKALKEAKAKGYITKY